MDREVGLETRDQILETLDELLDVAQGTIRKPVYLDARVACTRSSIVRVPARDTVEDI